MENTGLKAEVLDFIVRCAQENGLNRVVLFGSRARGDFFEKSDIDLAISGGDQKRFFAEIEEDCPTLLRFDYVDLDRVTSDELENEIHRDGIVLYEQV